MDPADRIGRGRGFGIVAYVWLGGPPLPLIPALLAPDLSMLGYLAGPRVGAVTYNLAHNWALAVAFVLLGVIVGEVWPCLIASVLAAHVGWDRALGYGLKLPSASATRTWAASAATDAGGKDRCGPPDTPCRHAGRSIRPEARHSCG